MSTPSARRPRTRALGTTSGSSRVLGQSLSVALSGAVFIGLGGAAAGTSLASDGGIGADEVAVLQGTFVSALSAAFLVCASIAAIGVVASLGRGPETRVGRA